MKYPTLADLVAMERKYVPRKYNVSLAAGDPELIEAAKRSRKYHQDYLAKRGKA